MQTWTFGPAGIYTATWDGVSRVTVTLTAGGAFVASFFAQSLTAAIASPEYQAILSPAPSSIVTPPLVATTGPAGFALQNATPNILTWTAPNDGSLHRVTVILTQTVTSNETGGSIRISYNDPLGNAGSITPFPGGSTAGTLPNSAGPAPLIVGANTQVVLKQFTALTAGAAVLWAELWAS